MFPRPSSRDDFQIAIICALPAEYDAVYDSFDDRWDEQGKGLGTAPGDPNRYVTGLMGDLAVVLVLLPGMGKVNAASAAASLRSSYRNLKWSLLVGVCGAVPLVAGAEVLLGDVIISRSVVQYDFGRQYSDEFVPKKTIEDTLGKPNKEIRILNALLKTRSNRDMLEARTAEFLQQLQAKIATTKHRGVYDYPGTTQDKFFKKGYRHKHQDAKDCKICEACSSHVDPVCLVALEQTCVELKCSDEEVDTRRARFRERQQLEQKGSVAAQAPAVYMGGIASGDKVMKSAEHRDRISQFHNVIAFEMEGAGVWDEVSCIVVKGVCDYADSHKQKNWQNFAASTAASAAKALLVSYFQADQVKEQISGPRSYYIPHAKNDLFVGRKDVISSLTELLFNKETKRVALVGLGGIGKTQVASQVAFWVKENMPDYSVFWMPALSCTSFEHACADMAKKLGISTTENEDIKKTIRTYLSSREAGRWLVVLDNADDETILYKSSDRSRRILDFIPQSVDGSLLLTTRSQKVAVKIARNKVVKLPPMSFHEARDLLEESLIDTDQLEEKEPVTKLLEKLTYLPLAIAQATAYMNIHKVPVARYLRLCESTSQDMIQLMSEAFLDDAHYTESQGAVATTWFISFKHIHETNASAAQLLSFITWIEPKTIPWSMLPSLGSEQEKTQAIGTLCGYGFLSESEEEGVFEMHSLVHLVMQTWTYKQGADEKAKTDVLTHLLHVFPSDEWENRDLWRQYMPHALSIYRLYKGVDASKGTELGYWLGRCLYKDNRIRESVKVLKEVVEIQQTTLAEDDSNRLFSEHDLAKAYTANGQVKEAIELLQHIVAIEVTFAKDDPARLTSQHELATAYHANGQVKDAVELLQYVVAIREASVAEDDPSRLASQHELARACLANRQAKEAVKLLQHVVAIEAVSIGEDHPDRLASVHWLAIAYRANGQVKEAIELLQHIVAVEATLAEDHPSRLASQHELARAYEVNGQVREAVELLQRIVAIEASLAENHTDRLTSQYELGRAYRANRQVKEAVELLQHVVAIEKLSLAEDHPSRLASQYELAKAYKANGQVKEALELLQHVVAIQATLPKDHPARLASQNLLRAML